MTTQTRERIDLGKGWSWHQYLRNNPRGAIIDDRCNTVFREVSRETALKLAAAMSAPVSVSAAAWQAIESAPSHKKVIVTGTTIDENERWYTIAERHAGTWYEENDQDIKEPTHWMPLPDAPTAQPVTGNALQDGAVDSVCLAIKIENSLVKEVTGYDPSITDRQIAVDLISSNVDAFTATKTAELARLQARCAALEETVERLSVVLKDIYGLDHYDNPHVGLSKLNWAQAEACNALASATSTGGAENA